MTLSEVWVGAGTHAEVFTPVVIVRRPSLCTRGRHAGKRAQPFLELLRLCRRTAPPAVKARG